MTARITGALAPLFDSINAVSAALTELRNQNASTNDGARETVERLKAEIAGREAENGAVAAVDRAMSDFATDLSAALPEHIGVAGPDPDGDPTPAPAPAAPEVAAAA